MTVQELIDELQKVKNKDLYIRIHGTVLMDGLIIILWNGVKK
jgi:hypothetical protein